MKELYPDVFINKENVNYMTIVQRKTGACQIKIYFKSGTQLLHKAIYPNRANAVAAIKSLTK